MRRTLSRRAPLLNEFTLDLIFIKTTRGEGRGRVEERRRKKEGEEGKRRVKRRCGNSGGELTRRGKRED